ncbi:MAG: hypothetical protein IT384_29215 [Deltaproteobacteria bacterium]|nr:hypothetical protein [Deltaproteobacteria bacterium]
MAKPTKYQELAGESEHHPVDVAVDRRLRRRHRKLWRRILRLGRAVLKTLPEARRRTFLRYEEAANRRAADREEMYCQLGYEVGLAEGRAQAQREQGSRARRALAKAIREAAVLAEATPAERVGAVLDVVAAIALTDERP